MDKIPQHLSLLTLGTRDVSKIREFYKSWGWIETDGSEDSWCAFDVGGTLISFYSIDDLAVEAGAEPAPKGTWNGVTLAMNVKDEQLLEAVFETAIRCGAIIITEIQTRDWGGKSGYVADPDGNLWELATGGPNPAT